MALPLRQVGIQFDQVSTNNNYSNNNNSSSTNNINSQYCSNRITTAKYGYSSFFPKFFYEQFRRYSNIFFTFIALFQQIPDVSPTGRYTTAVPLMCILGVSAVKELFEDMKRHKADRKVNESGISVLNKATLSWDLKRWQDVKVGDIIKCINENFFPSDLLLLSSSELNGMCYIETANLDGETNLKIRQSLPCIAKCSTAQDLKSTLSSATIECDLPNPRLYEFEGRLLMPNGVDTYPLGPDNILLRGAKLKNTRWIQGLVIYTGHESKLMINSLDKTPIKQSRLEKLTNIQILWLVCILLATGFLSAVFSHIWASGHMDFIKTYILADKSELQLGFGMTFLTFVILYNNLVPISLQVSLEVVRTFQAHFINSDIEMYDVTTDTYAQARTSNLNEELGQVRYILSDKTGTLTQNVMKFKKCTINGRMFDESEFDLVAECAQNEFPSDYDTALSSPDAIDGMSKNNNNNVKNNILVETIDSNNQFENKHIATTSDRKKVPTSFASTEKDAALAREFLTLLSICHTVVPQRTSLSNGQGSGSDLASAGDVTLNLDPRLSKAAEAAAEAAAAAAAAAPKAKHKRRHKSKLSSARRQPSTIDHGANSGAASCSVGENLEIMPIDSSDDILCERSNDMMMTYSSSNSSTNKSNSQLASPSSSILYHSASPDEGALVRGAQAIGYEFTNRTPQHVYINKFGLEEKYELLHVFEFDSFRKRMSVIVRKCSDKKIKIYTKGADTVILERLSRNQKNGDNKQDLQQEKMIELTESHLQRFALDGFRTLCCAYADIDAKRYDNWSKRFHEASLCLGDEKLKRIEACQRELESDLILLGATAIEDKLQDNVPETIDTLLKAGISFWLLTGDKQETAINIGYSCKLLSREMPLVIINQDSYEQTREQILVSTSSPDSALVIDGKSLQFVLSRPDLTSDFMRLALECKSIICCRVSPFQKASVVQLVKQMTGEVTLAIGDGANDVAMIRTANVGVGISGNEGLQAAHSADYTISQFRFLARLLLVHGSWSMSRLRQMILYSFYKNIALYVVEFWFAIVSAWSGQTIFERWTIGLYNVIFTAAPPFAIGVFDRRCSAHLMLRYPELYKVHITHQSYTIRSFWVWILTAFWHSLLLFWGTYALITHDNIWSNGLSDGGYLVFGNMLYTYVVVTVCLKAGLEMHSWTRLTHLAIWGSISSWFIFLIIYSRLWPTFPIAADMVAIDELVFSSWVFWFGLALVPFSALIADIIYKVVRKTCYRSLADEFKSTHILEQNTIILNNNNNHNNDIQARPSQSIRK